mmetsp:Transcript_17496/g.26173  ORF Transcript_17496/g.26173 Transcript_17496/m.26173 type:complete len:537 (-) Transcript_17496:77-1687(-)
MDDEEWMDMSQPRHCSINRSRDGGGFKTVILGETRTRKTTSNGISSYVDIPVELRGITPLQLKAIRKNATRRCNEEHWEDRDGNKVDPEKINLYVINTYVIKPFTEFTKKSLVESLPSTAGTQPPWWFGSHWWGDPFPNLCACIDALIKDFQWNMDESEEARGGGMTMDTPIWICAFANNQWDLGSAVTSDPLESSFVKAMKEAHFRVVSFLDRDGIVFTRIWCAYELYIANVLRKKQLMNESESIGLWVVYTHTAEHEHAFDIRKAVGIIPGRAPGELPDDSSVREKHFPIELILQSIQNTNVHRAEASEEVDRIHILNSIIRNNDLDAIPPDEHPAYDEVNNAVRGAFAMTDNAIRAALEDGGEDTWKMVMNARSESGFDGSYRLNFINILDDSQFDLAFDIVSHLPLTYIDMGIWNAFGETAEGAVKGLIDWLERTENIKGVMCSSCYMDDDAKRSTLGSQLANVLVERHAQSIEVLDIWASYLMDSQNLSDWTAAIKKMNNLKKLDCREQELSEDELEIVRQAASHVEGINI